MKRIALLQLFIADLCKEVARVEYFKQQFITLLTILTHQGAESFHRRGLYLLEAIELINLLDGVENIIALSHLHWREVARSFRNTWFLCHIRFLWYVYTYLRTIVCSRSGPIEIILMGVSS